MPPQYSGWRRPSISVRSRSLIRTASCWVIQCVATPNRCSACTQIIRNSVPWMVRARSLFGALVENGPLQLSDHPMQFHGGGVRDVVFGAADHGTLGQVRVVRKLGCAPKFWRNQHEQARLEASDQAAGGTRFEASNCGDVRIRKCSRGAIIECGDSVCRLPPDSLQSLILL